MTKREFYNAVLSMENVADDVREKANELIAALDNEAARRSSRPSKKSAENEPIKAAILDLLTSQAVIMLSSEVAAALEISTAKASSLLQQLEAEGKVTGETASIPKQGKRKQWKIAATEEVEE